MQLKTPEKKSAHIFQGPHLLSTFNYNLQKYDIAYNGNIPLILSSFFLTVITGIIFDGQMGAYCKWGPQARAYIAQAVITKENEMKSYLEKK